MASAKYPVGLTIAPIMHFEGWQDQYVDLFRRVGAALEGITAVDLTAELITHRFTPKSKDVLLNWYPRTPLDMEEARRAEKRTKFGTFKYVYPSEPMAEMKAYLHTALAEILPNARVLYWT